MDEYSDYDHCPVCGQRTVAHPWDSDSGAYELCDPSDEYLDGYYEEEQDADDWGSGPDA